MATVEPVYVHGSLTEPARQYAVVGGRDAGSTPAPGTQKCRGAAHHVKSIRSQSAGRMPARREGIATPERWQIEQTVSVAAGRERYPGTWTGAPVGGKRHGNEPARGFDTRPVPVGP